MRGAKLIGTGLFVAVALLAVTGLPAAAITGTKWYVGNNGDDGFVPTCGGKINPCRSISKAISLAAPGDTVIVGPGIYGDLNRSGTFGDFPGEETAEIGSGCDCMIKVDKQLTIVSRDGAEVTLLDAAGLTQSVVHILGPQANGTVLGKVNKGFSLLNGGDSGLLIDDTSQTVRVQGNIASANNTGFDISGAGGIGTGTTVRVLDNIAEGNGDGFSLSGTFNLMQHNRAVDNSGAGFVVAGSGHTVKQNVAVQNDNGFEPTLSTGMTHPFAPPSGFTQNAAIANATAGVSIQTSDALGVNISLDKSNLYGNGDPNNNCGLAIDNEDANLSDIMAVAFTGDYWGASTGIGANPADTAGGTCTGGPGASAVTLSTVSPAVKEFGIAQKPLK